MTSKKLAPFICALLTLGTAGSALAGDANGCFWKQKDWCANKQDCQQNQNSDKWSNQANGNCWEQKKQCRQQQQQCDPWNKSQEKQWNKDGDWKSNWNKKPEEQKFENTGAWNGGNNDAWNNAAPGWGQSPGIYQTKDGGQMSLDGMGGKTFRSADGKEEKIMRYDGSGFWRRADGSSVERTVDGRKIYRTASGQQTIIEPGKW